MKVEILEGDSPLLEGEFPQVPKIGEYLAIEREGIFGHYNVVEVWYRDNGTHVFQPCVRVELED